MIGKGLLTGVKPPALKLKDKNRWLPYIFVTAIVIYLFKLFIAGFFVSGVLIVAVKAETIFITPKVIVIVAIFEHLRGVTVTRATSYRIKI